MKKLIFFLIIIINSLSSLGQSPNWIWAKSAESGNLKASYVQSIATDKYGNAFIVGSFQGDTMFFGTTLLVNTYYSGVGLGQHSFIAKYDSYGNVLWAKNAGEYGRNSVSNITADNYGNSYITGDFGDTIIFDKDTLINASLNEDIFIVKYDSLGNVAWAKSIGGYDNDRGLSIYVDLNNSVYLTGYFSSIIITFDTISLNGGGNTEFFIAKYDSSGNVIWAKKSFVTNWSYGCGYCITADLNGNVYIGGGFGGTLLFDNDTLISLNGLQDIFIVKYDSSGNVIWANSATGTEIDYASEIATDTNGYVYLAGIFESQTITFGNNTLVNAASTGGTNDVFVAKYNSVGNLVWVKSSGGTNNDYIRDISADANGNLYFIGDIYSDSIIFGNITLINNNSGFSDPQIFIVKYDSSGNTLWVKSPGGVNNRMFGYCIDIDSMSNVYVAGTFQNIITFGATTLTTAAGSAIFLAKLDSTIVTINSELSAFSGTIISPNPTASFLYINSYPITTYFTFSVFSYTGAKILEVNNKTSIDVTGLANGLYFAEIKSGEKIIRQKFIKK